MAEALELLASLGFTTRAGRQIHANLVDGQEMFDIIEVPESMSQDPDVQNAGAQIPGGHTLLSSSSSRLHPASHMAFPTKKRDKEISVQKRPELFSCTRWAALPTGVKSLTLRFSPGGENSASRSPGRSKPPKSNYYYFPTSVLFGSFIVARSQQLLLRWASHAIPFQIRISMSDPRQEPVILQTQRNDTTDASMLKYFEGGSKQSP
ncbi:hypothetical protein BDFG_00622 [Blastomyces dermatitidis ATCC 26199]|nr:hypothetical protein BDFG_00622 [Blastomyces dermatitidis ATCC 26199]